MNEDPTHIKTNAEIAIEFQEQVEKSLAPTQNDVIRHTIFYGDPGAEQAFKDLDDSGKQVFLAMMNPDHPMHKVFGKGQFLEVLKLYHALYQFRASLDWAKEQHYVQGYGAQRISPISTTTVNIGHDGKGFAEEKVINYE